MRLADPVQNLLDRAVALVALTLFSPLLIAAMIAIFIEDGRPVLFRQVRIGRNGVPFFCLKLRSMRQAPGARITSSSDSRITRVGRVLRAYKLDEFPQFLNVLRGEMSLIGPRPEVPAYVDLAVPAWRQVLSVRPGISDLATLVYRDEERLLAQASDPEQYYRNELLPRKLNLSSYYIQNRSLIQDLKLLFLTARYSFASAGHRADTVMKAFSIPESV